MRPAGPFLGAVLCGGASTRMGTDKALIVVGGTTLAERACRVLAQGGANPVVCVGGDAGRLTSLGLTVVPDADPGEGPLGGVLTALAHSQSVSRAGAVVVACDMPQITVEVIDALITRASAAPAADIVWASSAAGVEPLLAAYRLTCVDTLREAFDAGERALHRAVAGLRVESMALEDPAVAQNVNWPADLA
jgi:molybdopterin-guanine dinucleotide biosynthesis protein A